MPDLDVSLYTPMLRRLLRAIGIGGTTALLRWRGGCRLCLPQSPERSELRHYLTYSQAQGLIDEFGAGMCITLPKPDKLFIAARNAEIRSEHLEGDSLATLALRYGLTTRHITNIIASNDDQYADVADDSQANLF